MEKPKKELKKEKEGLNPRIIELLYRDVFNTNDRVNDIYTQNREIIRLLSELLALQKNIQQIEERLFKEPPKGV